MTETSFLENPVEVVSYLRAAVQQLGLAHQAAGERCDDDRDNLIGAVRDAIFGLNTAVDALAQMIEEGRFSELPQEQETSATTRSTIQSDHLAWP